MEREQIRELGPLLREAYMSSRPVFGEVRRTSDGVLLIVGMIEPKTAAKVQRLLSP